MSARLFSGLIACAVAAFVAVGSAGAVQPALKPKVDYIDITPQPVPPGGRIEVVEFFWYGCPHCHNLQPALESWLKRKPADVDLRRVPAVFRESWAAHARVFYTLEALGEVERLHQSVYRALHVNREPLGTAEETADWAARNGIQPSRWLAVYDAPETLRKVEQSKTATKAYMVPGTPALVVDGRYLTSSGMAETMEDVIAHLEGLIVLARERRSAR